MKKIVLLLKKILIKEAFKPSLLGIFLNPFYLARKELYKNIKTHSHHINGKILDIGCGSKPYKSLFKYSEYIGIDIKQNNKEHLEEIDAIFDGYNIPFKDESFDSFICNQVIEHVFDVNKFLNSIKRVLKNKAKGIITIPFIWDEHEQPNDFGRYTSFGIKSILKKNGFNTIKIIKTNNNTNVIFQILILYLYKSFSKNKILNLLLSIFLYSIINILSYLFLLFPKNKDMFLDLVILVEKIEE